MDLFKKLKLETFKENRLVWNKPGGAPAPEPPAAEPQKDAAADKPLDQINMREVHESASDKMNAVAERVKNLSLNAGLDEGGLPKPIKMKYPSAFALHNALRSAVRKPIEGGDKKESIASQINVPDVALFLMNGLLEQLGSADTRPSNYNGRGEIKELGAFFNRKKIKSFIIQDGKWKFFDKDGGNIEDDFRLDDQDAVEQTDDGPRGGKSEIQDPFISSHVKQIREKEEADRKAKEAAETAETERLKPENLKKVSTSSHIDINKDTSLENFINPLVALIPLPEGQKIPPIKPEEMQKALMKYLSDIEGDSDEAKFKKFMENIAVDGYNKVSIKNGKFIFETADGKKTSNPRGLIENGSEFEAYAHEKLIEAGAAEAKKEAVEREQEQALLKPKPNPLDGTEREMARILSRKKKGEVLNEKDMDRVDSRYLAAMDAILQYDDGAPVEISMLFNDKPIEGKFYKAKNGNYILKWGKGVFTQYNPKAKGKAGLMEAKKHFAKDLNSGALLQRMQYRIFKQKNRLEQWNIKIDAGPEKVADSGIKYELDWDTGDITGDDPDVTMYAGPHGEIRVKVEQEDISLDGKSGTYEFRAGGFQDMIRILESLRKWVEASPDERKKLKGPEEERRFFDQGVDGLSSITKKSAGKLLKVDSVRAANVVGDYEEDKVYGDASIDLGYTFEFDWMQKMAPPLSVHLRRVEGDKPGADRYHVAMEPFGELLGGVTADSPFEAYSQMVDLVAMQKELLTTVGGEKLMQKRVADLVKEYGKAEFVDGVIIKGYSNGRVYLSRERGMRPFPFLLGVVPDGKGGIIPNEPVFEQAMKMGYMVEAGAKAALSEPGEVLPSKPVEKVTVLRKVGTPAEIPDISHKWAPIKDILQNRLELEEDGPEYNSLKNYLAYKIVSLEAPAKDDEGKKAFFRKEVWKILAEMVKIPMVDESGEDKKWQDSVIKKLKSEKFTEKFQYPLAGVDLKNHPQTRAMLQAIKDSLDGLSDMFGEKQALFEKAKTQYLKDLDEFVTELYKTDYAAGEELDETEMDKKFLTLVIGRTGGRMKIPVNFFKHYLENEQSKEVHKQEDARIERKSNPHQMTFAEFEKSRMAGLGKKAMEIFKGTDAVKLDRVFLSKIKGNKPTSARRMYFNVKAGVEPNLIPLTIRISKNASGALVLSSAHGWNNRATTRYSSKIRKETMKDMINQRVYESGRFGMRNNPESGVPAVNPGEVSDESPKQSEVVVTPPSPPGQQSPKAPAEPQSVPGPGSPPPPPGQQPPKAPAGPKPGAPPSAPGGVGAPPPSPPKK